MLMVIHSLPSSGLTSNFIIFLDGTVSVPVMVVSARLTDLPPPPPLLWPGDDGYDDDEVPEIPKQVAPCTLGLVEAGTGAVSLLGYTGYVRVC